MPVNDEQPAPVRRCVDGARFDLHRAVVAHKPGDVFIMVAGDVYHPRPLASGAQQLLDHVIVRLRPVDAPPHGPDVDQIAHNIERLKLVGAQKFQERIGGTAFGAQVNVGNPCAAVVFYRLGMHPVN